MFKQWYTALSNTEKRVLWLIIAIAVLLGAFSSTLVDTLLGAPNFQYAAVNAVPFIIFALSVTSAVLLFNGRADIASWTLLIGTLIGFLITSSQAEGFGLPSAFMLLVITLFVPLQLLKGRSAIVAMWTCLLRLIPTIQVGSMPAELTQGQLFMQSITIKKIKYQKVMLN